MKDPTLSPFLMIRVLHDHVPKHKTHGIGKHGAEEAEESRVHILRLQAF
jgi:hypothetical protein